MTRRVTPSLRKTTRKTDASELIALAESGVWACDFYVTGAEGGAAIPGGYQLGRIRNIDHHAPTDRMARRVSSGTLARAQVLAEGLPPTGDLVVVNHTDCDSVLSSGIMSGRLDPLEAFSDAAIAADHTGEANAIADLLQALDSRKDLEVSFAALERLLTGMPQPSDVQAALDARLTKRARAGELVAGGRMRRSGGLYWAELERGVDGELFPALLPDAVTIMLASPMPNMPGHWQVTVRLGPGAPAGMWLNRLEIEGFDPNYGGRWNAGSNSRGGGTETAPERYAELLAGRLSQLLPQTP